MLCSLVIKYDSLDGVCSTFVITALERHQHRYTASKTNGPKKTWVLVRRSCRQGVLRGSCCGEERIRALARQTFTVDDP